MEILFASLAVFAAYFLKGFTGFGPALVLIPFFTILFDAGTAINAAAFFDFFAGAFLMWQVRSKLNWSFVLSVFASLAAGAFFGSLLLGIIPVYWLEKVIGVAIFVFALVILFQRNNEDQNRNYPEWHKYIIAAFGGFIGGFIGITGPPLVIYMKLRYHKEFFRTQLIGVFFFGSFWRFVLYQWHGVNMNLTPVLIALFLGIMIMAQFAGSRLHKKVNEQRFNRIIALVLMVPALQILLSG